MLTNRILVAQRFGLDQEINSYYIDINRPHQSHMSEWRGKQQGQKKRASVTPATPPHIHTDET